MPKMIEKIENGRQYRNMQIEVRSLDDGEYIVKGYATVFNEEYLLCSYGSWEFREIIDAHAFDDCDMSDAIMQFDHEGRVFARISNNTLKLKIDAHGLYMEAYLGGTEEGRNLYEDIKGGYITKMSFGFKVEEDERTHIENHDTGKEIIVRRVTKISKLYDVSAVSLPANDATEISARSYSDGVIRELEAERLKEQEYRRNIEALKLRIKLMEV